MIKHGGEVSRRGIIRTAAALGVLGAGGTSVVAGDDTVEVNVGYSRPSGRRAARDEARSVEREFNFDALTIRTSREGADRLSRRGDIRYVEENGEWEALGETLPWGIDRVDAEVAHANGETGSGADISIIDTGIDSDHPDLQENLGQGVAYVGCKGNPRMCREPWDDDHDHGTHCAGIADAVAENSEGVVGVSTEATLHAVKVLDKNGSGTWSDVAAGIQWTADQGYDVGSLSLGGSSGSQTVKDACVYANDKGVLLVAAAGNDGPCTDCVGYPAAYDEVMAISATDDKDLLAGFSSTGPEIELAAPGDDVYSTVIGGYDTFSGTSMACPHVSGAGGQLMANHELTNDDARQQLKDTAEDIGLTASKQGAGLLDVATSLGHDSSDDLSGSDDGGSNSAPTVDSLSASEVETDSSDAEFDVDWQVSDPDENLDAVDLTLTDDTDGGTEDTATIGVSGGSASGTTRLVAAGDDGSGNSYTVEAVVTDSDGASDTSTASATETEDTSGGNAPTVDSLSLSEDNSGGSPHAEFDASWGVSDSDGDLDTVELTLYELDGGGKRVQTEDSASVDVSGSDVTGTTGLKAKFDENSGQTYEVELIVRDANGNTASASETEIEDGS